MSPNFNTLYLCLSLFLKTVTLAATWSGMARRKALKKIAAMTILEQEKEIIFLREKVFELKTQVSILQKQLKKKNDEPASRYTLQERLTIIWHMEYFQIPRNKVKKYFGIATSTLYRWLRKIDNQTEYREPVNKTPAEIANLVFEIAKANITWGRVRITNQLALLNIFLASSTVHNILKRPEPKKKKPGEDILSAKNSSTDPMSLSPPRSIPAWYPNHVWSIDCTIVLSWGLWPTYLLVIIDHYSRKVISSRPMEGPNTGWALNIIEDTIEVFGAPKHIITDQGSIFTGIVFADFLAQWDIKHRLGAVNKHGSISVTERVIKTLKYEWLNRAPLPKGFDHITSLCQEFTVWYNQWRPHMTLEGGRPDDKYFLHDWQPPAPEKNAKAKVIPVDFEIEIEKKYFKATRVTGFRLKKAA